MFDLITFLNKNDIPYDILPEGLEVGGSLDLSNTQITSLPGLNKNKGGNM